MKFIVQYCENNHLNQQIPAPVQFEMIEASRTYLEDLRKREKISDYGFYGSGNGLYAIFNVKSHGELLECTELLPARRLYEVQSTAVIEQGEFGDVYGKIKRDGTAQWDRLNKMAANATTSNVNNRY